MAPQKRPAAASPVASPGKRGRSDPNAKKAAEIAAELASAKEIPVGLAKMLGGMVPIALSTPKEDRHPFQAEVVDMVSTALQMIETGMKKEIGEQQAAPGALEEKVARKAALDAATAALESLRQATAQAKTAMGEKVAAEASAKTAHKEALAAQKRGDKDIDAALARKEEIEEVLTKSLAPLKEVAAEGKVGSTGLQAILKTAKLVGVDESLIQGLPNVLKKAPAARGAFDQVIIDGLEGHFKSDVEQLGKTLQDGQSGKDERAAVAEAARAAHEKTAEELKAAKASHKEAAAAENEGETKRTAAEAAVKSFLPDMKVAMDSLDELKQRLTALQEGPCATYAELKELQRPVEEPVADELAPEEAVESHVAEEVGTAPVEAPAGGTTPVEAL